MNVIIDKIPDPKRMIGVVAAIVLVFCGMAAVLPWEPATDGLPGLEPARVTLADPADERQRTSAKCPECGVVESTRFFHEHSGPGVRADGEVPENPIKISEITIRMNDGVSHQFTDANPAIWKVGERVMFIQGYRSTNQ